MQKFLLLTLYLLTGTFLFSNSPENSPNIAGPGINNPTAIAKFLNGNLPTTLPNPSNAPALLSQTGAFANLNTLDPTPGVIPYDMIEPFWSDGASKFRWMAIPNDGTHDTSAEQIQFSADGNWVFPKGTVMIKHFELGGKRLETRFEVLGDDGAYYYLTYKWNAAQTDADLLINGLDETVMVNGSPQVWHYPSLGECQSCHTPEAAFVLGPKTRNLNKEITYPSTGIVANQLVTLSFLGIITETITDANAATYAALAAKDDLSASLEYRARSYIDVNCSYCHQPGTINGGLFDARITTPLVDQNIIYGPVIYDEGLVDPKVVIPQDVPRSMMHHRMNSLVNGVTMPPLGKNVVDAAGVQLIADWINSLTPASSFPPEASFSATPVFGTAPLIVNFDASASNDNDGDPLTYTWDFGDGNTATGLMPVHSYNTPGSYLVTLTVSDGSFTDVSSTTITVNLSNPGSNTVTFTDETNLITGSHFSGVAIAVSDMNADGKDDIIRFNQGSELNIQYQNGPGQMFTYDNFGDVSSNNPWGVCIADYDKNGFNDIQSGGYYDGVTVTVNNNLSYSQFVVPDSDVFMQGNNFADINNDGWIDMFACHDDAESKAFVNNQDGTYSYDPQLISTETNPTSDNSGNYASMWTDYDNDGDLDLYISKCRLGVNDPTDPRRINMLWQNDGNNNYTEVAAAANLKITAQSWLSDFGDIDNDGDLDALVINHYDPSKLMRNNNDGTFTDITLNSGIDQTLDGNEGLGIQALFRDFNNDGYVDIIYTGASHFMFYNNGDGTFTQAPNPFNSNQIESLAVGDLNHDGFLDVYAGYANIFNNPSSISDRLFMNDGNSNHFLNINLQGVISNINGIGARIEVYGVWGKQIREVRSGEGYGIHNSLNKHFGVGQATSVDSIVVRWPSGIIQTIDDYNNVDEFLTICELFKSSCDDGDPMTFADEYNENCDCVGFAQDTDNDGIPDNMDLCPSSAPGFAVDTNGCITGCTNPSDPNYLAEAQVDDGSCNICQDGTQNGDETGVDCGGAFCDPCPTCSDGIQNQDETDIDCGGSICLACPTCFDGIKNGDETGVDCGGNTCPACPTCSDGIQNQDETDIDCGGTICPACPTCNDGIQNQGETGIDCGGPNCADCPEDCATYDFTNQIVTYDTDGGSSSFAVQDGGATAFISNNAWKAVPLNYTVTPNTVIEFDFKSTIEGEVHGLAFDNDLNYGPDHFMVFYGNQGYNGTFNTPDYSGSGNYEHFTIQIGANFTGFYQYLVLIADNDQEPLGESYFSNFQIYEDTNNNLTCDECTNCPTCFDGIQNQGETNIDCGGPICAACPTCDDGILNGDETGVDCGGTTCAACVEVCSIYDFTNQVVSYDPNGNDNGTSTVLKGGSTVLIESNGWKAVPINYTVTPNTVIEFDFKSSVEGEIHELGFDNDLTFAPDERIVVYGTQGYNGTFTTPNYSGSGNYEHFTISLGNNFTGFYQYLVLAADDDANANGESYFSNIQIYEDLNGNQTCDSAPTCKDDYANGGLSNSYAPLGSASVGSATEGPLLDNNADFEVSGKIMSDQKIGSNNSAIGVDYDAGDCIELLPGFEVKVGVEFDAFIDPQNCNNQAGGNQ